MQIYKEGIEKTIRESQWGHYKELGYIQIGVTEDKPEQEEIEVIDDYVVSKPKTKAKAKKK